MVIPSSRALCRARISSLATYVPPRVLTNADDEAVVADVKKQVNGFMEQFTLYPEMGN